MKSIMSMSKLSKSDLSLTMIDSCLKIKYKLFSSELLCIDFSNISLQFVNFLDLACDSRFK